MARVKSLETLIADVKKAEQDVAAKKEAYQEAVQKYKVACEKKDAMVLKEINDAMVTSTKSLDDVLEFLKANQKKETTEEK